ncbi:MAG: hypothetical protein AAGU19_15240 [Prolixibacteraceae bacterium]
MAIKSPVLILVALIAISLSCSDDFLNDNEKTRYTATDPLIISTKSAENIINLSIPAGKNRNFHISTYPRWLQFESLQGTFQEGTASLLFTFVHPGYEPEAGYFAADLVVTIENAGLFCIKVICGNFGSVGDKIIGNVTGIAGTVTDAAYHKASDQLILATESPNQLIFFDAVSEKKTTVTLEKRPKCIDISESENLVAIGFSVAELALYGLETRALIRSFPLDCIPHDLALGSNGWCYISPAGQGNQALRSLRLSNGAISKREPVNSHFYSNSLVRKVTAKPLLMITRTTVIPSGLLLYDITGGVPNDTINYWPDDLYDLWPANEGNRFITGTGKVCQMPAYTPVVSAPADLGVYGDLQPHQPFVNHVDESVVKNCFFVSERNTLYLSQNQNSPGIIEQFDRNSLSVQNSWQPSSSVISNNSTLIVAFNAVNYAFANRTGTKLLAVRSIAPDFGINQWSVEIFKID